MPKLNGYAPISVKITDSFNDNGVVYTYNDNTRNYTAKREYNWFWYLYSKGSELTLT